MKKIVIKSLALSLPFLMACGKSDSGNKGVIEESEETTVMNNPDDSIDSTYSATQTTENGTQETYRYVATDNSSALVTFADSDKEHSISVKSNNKVIKAERVEGSMDTYKNEDITIVAKNDSVNITQNGMVIELVKAKTSND